MALRFTQRDFLGLREEMIRFMQEKLGDEWNDYSESDETITLIELLAHCVSNLHFAYDNQKRECDIVTASFPRNVYAQAIRNGYKPSLFKAGKTWLNIDLRKKSDGNITDEYTTLPVSIIIPRYTQIKNDSGDICITNREFVIPAGTSHFSIEVLAGEYAFEQFTRNDINSFNYIVLNRLNIAYGTTRLFYQKEEWTSVVDVYTDPRTSKIYSLEPNFVQNGVRNIIKFFSTWPDEIIDNSTIIFEYIQTFGANSNYEKDTFTSFLDLNDLSTNTVTFDDDIFDSSGNDIKTWTDVEVCFSQPKAFVNGQNFESVDVIKKSYIQSVRQTTSLVTLDDYNAFITLKSLNDFYVTDWNKNSQDLITIEYPKDIKALKAEEDSEGHSIFSPENTTTEPYWPDTVSYINSVDNVVETRKIQGREIVIYKSFDVNLNDFKQYENEHWYIEWVNASRTTEETSSFNSITPSIYILSPDRIDDSFLGNYDNRLGFIDSQSRNVKILRNLYTDETQEKKIRLFVYNADDDSLLCAKFDDLYYLAQMGYKCSTSFCSNVFKSYFMKNEITSLMFDNPPVCFDSTLVAQSNIADIMFSSKNKIYNDEFKTELSNIYGDKYEKIKKNEVNIKNSLRNKISSISVKIDGIDSEIIIPSSVWFDTFLIIDGNSDTTNSGDVFEFKHSVYKSPDSVYDVIGYFDYNYIDDYIIDPHKEDAKGLPVLNLYHSKNDKIDSIDSGDLNKHEHDTLYNNISLCFRKKTIDLLDSLDFVSLENDDVLKYSETQTNNGVEYEYFYNGDKNSYIQSGVKGLNNFETIYIPVISSIGSFYAEKTTPYKLRYLTPCYYLKENNSYSDYNSSLNAYIAITTQNDSNPFVSINDDFYHDDCIFDKDQLTAVPLNLHYYRNLLLQQNVSNITNDECDIVYVEEHTVNKCNDYTLPSSLNINDLKNSITSEEYLNSKFGFLRTALGITGDSRFDYKSNQNNAINLTKPITDISKRLKYIKDSFLLDVQISYPKYLKYLILRTCLIHTVDYTMTNKQLNEELIKLGVDNIIYALDKILKAKYSITYWYSDSNATVGKQYTYSPNENKRFLCCGGLTSWDENVSPSKNYFRWNVVFPEIVDLYQSIQQKQGRGDAVYILPYKKSGVDIHAHIFIDPTTTDVSSVFENIWNALISSFGLLKNIEDVKYLSEIISIIQSSDVNIFKICTLNEDVYKGTYSLIQPSEDSIYRTDVSESSIKDFYKFLSFYPTEDIKQSTNLGQAFVLGTVCIRLQKLSNLEKTVYHFERSCFKIDTTLAYMLNEL